MKRCGGRQIFIGNGRRRCRKRVGGRKRKGRGIAMIAAKLAAQVLPALLGGLFRGRKSEES
jgi:hypothetical protein